MSLSGGYVQDNFFLINKFSLLSHSHWEMERRMSILKDNNKKKYLGVSLTRILHERLYNKNFTSYWKIQNRIWRNGKMHIMFLDWKNSIIEIRISPKLIYKSNSISTKNLPEIVKLYIKVFIES